jgi:ABC-type iron transport system FetAB permease component
MKSPNSSDGWVKWWFLAMAVLFVLIMASCNTVKKAEKHIQEQTTTIYLRDTVHVKVVDTSRIVTELQEFNTKTIELYDTVYKDVPVLRQRIIYENVKQQRTESQAGITKDSVAGSVSNTQAFSKVESTSSKKSNRIPFIGIIIGGIVIIIIYGIRKTYH